MNIKKIGLLKKMLPGTVFSENSSGFLKIEFTNIAVKNKKIFIK
jgi:hypothetical protein